MAGWTTKARDRFAHHLFKKEKFCRGYAWDWLCDHAAFQPMMLDVEGKSVQLERGQLCYSIRQLADIWNWDKGAVSRFLARLEALSMIERGTDTGKSLITICNYEKYNNVIEGGETAPDTPTETVARHNRDTKERRINNYKKLEEEKADAARVPEGDLFGDVKPAKPKKAEAGKSAVEILSEIMPEETAKDFIEHRKQLKAPLTPKAAHLMVSKLRGCRNVVAVVNTSIENGWKGVFPEKENFKGGSGYQQRQSGPQSMIAKPAAVDPIILRMKRMNQQ